MSANGGQGINGSIMNLLAEWWGGDSPSALNTCWSPLAMSAASNLRFGGNPKYQVSDFLAMYPKFGIQPQAITDMAVVGTMTGYAVNDQVFVNQTDAQGAILKVGSVDSNGAIIAATIVQGGTGYSIASSVPTTTSGSGTGALVNILAISSPNLIGIPPLVLQMFINLASASLQAAKWCELWPFAISLYVAHFATLYLRSEGSNGTTPGQVAASGLTRGIMVSKSAGGVSAGIQVPVDLAEWGAWAMTEYGIQLIAYAKVVGMGPMYAVGGPAF